VSEALRNNIGNILGTIGKLRGGTAFTEAEKKLIESYTPTIDDNPLQIKSKTASLKTFIKNKRENLLRVAAGDYSAPKNDGGAKTVKMRSPNGQEKDVPADKVDFYKSKGAMVVSN
jgi:hypothetical protein